MKKMKFKITSFMLAIVICFSSSFAPIASLSVKAETVPEWVKEGEEWYLANDKLREGTDSCKYGHSAPSGYKYQGYTTGYAVSDYKAAAQILNIVSAFSGNNIACGIASLATIVADWLTTHNSISIKYYHYVYYNGSNYWNHIIYVDNSTGYYYQISCETGYGLW